MTTATKTVTMTQLRKAAAAKWGKLAFVEHNPKAPDAAERAEQAAKRAEAKQKLETVMGLVKQQDEKKARETLLEAAKFVCDVDGDHPSIEQLQAAIVQVEIINTLKEERDELSRECSQLAPRSTQRWQAGHDDYRGPLPMRMIYCSADTAEELLTLIQNSKR